MSHERRSRRFRTRLLALAIGTAMVAAGVVAGCGITDLGSLVLAGDASENVGAKLPPEAAPPADAQVDSGLDAPGDNQIPVLTKCEDVCPAATGGHCEDGGTNTCVFNCDGGFCEAGVTCPAGVPCKVGCGLDKSCPFVDCTKAAGCDIQCGGKDSCGTVACAGKNCVVDCKDNDSCSDGGVTCTANNCVIDCSGGGKTCEGPISCTGSASCTVKCETGNSCLGGVTTTNVADAQVLCLVDNSCLGGATCAGGKNCLLGCKGPSCGGTNFCCDASVCVVDSGTNSCP